MTYVPYEAVVWYMQNKWKQKVLAWEKMGKPGDPPKPPTNEEINTQWHKWLDWWPPSAHEYDQFRKEFPLHFRDKMNYSSPAWSTTSYSAKRRYR